MSGINQKEYLKKYLGIGKGTGDKKRKKKSRKLGSGLKIVDDDVDVRLDEEIKVDLTADNEEAPQIVSVIDDRPPSLRIDEETHSKLWKPIGAPDEPEQTEKSIEFKGNMALVKLRTKQPFVSKGMYKELNREERKNNIASLTDSSPSRQYGSEDTSSPRRHRDNDGDSSPPRRHRAKSNMDLSPPRKARGGERDISKNNIASSTDSSPSRQYGSEDTSSSRRHGDNDGDSSPPRRSRAKSNMDLSPPRKVKGAQRDISPPRKIKIEKNVDSSPPRRRRDSPPPRKKSRWADDSEDTSEKMEKTLDGKTAGLQNAADLVKETAELKKREDELFKKLSVDVSGANAATIVRRKNKEVDPEEEEMRRKVEEENKEKYNRWGKGLKQVEDVNERIKSDLHEMSKPLARYADDEDLEKHLKDQEREGDPMLAYIRQKKRKKAVVAGTPAIQQYEGDAPPNRFGIRPGYRWDGVDRSSGYEKKWFEVQNSRMASIEENYKWSTEDM